MIWLLTQPISRQQVLSLFLSLLVCRLSSLLTVEGGVRVLGVGAKLNDGEKAWSSIHHSILSGPSNRSIAFLIRTKHIQLTNYRVGVH
jgi:hypothetical protein